MIVPLLFLRNNAHIWTHFSKHPHICASGGSPVIFRSHLKNRIALMDLVSLIPAFRENPSSCSPPAPVPGMVAVVAFQAGGCVQVHGVAVVAGCSLVVDAVLVAAAAAGVRAVEDGRAPGAGVVALVARHTREQAEMESRVGVTGRADRGQAGENVVDVALRASHRCMRTRQWELRLRVVERGREPAAGGMAGAAPAAELAFVRVVLGVAVVAVLGGALHIGNAAGSGMAACAGCAGVFAGQLEGYFGVVEIVPVSVDPVVAAQAGFPVSQQVCLHEIGLDLLVAGGADGLVKLCIAMHMASNASKRRTIRLMLVGSKGVPKSIM
jgi:hypothetical protein